MGSERELEAVSELLDGQTPVPVVPLQRLRRTFTLQIADQPSHAAIVARRSNGWRWRQWIL
jgi:hypothetical protein